MEESVKQPTTALGEPFRERGDYEGMEAGEDCENATGVTTIPEDKQPTPEIVGSPDTLPSANKVWLSKNNKKKKSRHVHVIFL